MANQTITISSGAFSVFLGSNPALLNNGAVSYRLDSDLIPPGPSRSIHAFRLFGATSRLVSVGIQLGLSTDTSDLDGRLSDTFSRTGHFIFRQESTNISITFAVADASSRQTGELYSFVGRDLATAARTFIRAVDTSRPLIIEIWDREPPPPGDEINPTFNAATTTSTLTTTLFHIKVIKTITIDPMLGDGRILSRPFISLIKADPPAFIATEHIHWQERMHNLLQRIPQAEGIPSLQERVFPDVIPLDADPTIPHAIWYETSNIEIDSFEGSFESAIRATLEFRSQSRFEANRLRRAAVGWLRRNRVIRRVNNVSALYDLETQLRREIVDCVIEPFPPPIEIRSSFIKGNPWSSQWGRQFG